MLTTKTMNGAACLTAVGAAHAQTANKERGGALVTLSAMMVGPRPASKGHAGPGRRAARGATAPTGITRDSLASGVQAVLDEAAAGGMSSQAAQDNVVDLLCLAFHAGDVREGRGERTLFCWFALQLLQVIPATVLATVKLVPQYASFRLLNMLYAEAKAMAAAAAAPAGAKPELKPANLNDAAAVKGAMPERLAALCTTIEDVYLAALQADWKAVQDAGRTGAKLTLSLAGKWAPRLTSSPANRPLGKALRDRMFPITGVATASAKSWASMRYRQVLTALNRALKTVEVPMAAGRYIDIEPTHVPSLALRKYRKALQNKTAKGEVRHADNPDRVATAAKFLESATKALADPTVKSNRMKGSGNAPHQLVEAYLKINGYSTSTEAAVDPLVEAMWSDAVQSLKEKGALRSCVALVDVSGSMTCCGGVPMKVAVALGLLVSDAAPEPWKGEVLTFESQPKWLKLPATTLLAKTKSMVSAPWGGSTNFHAAMDMLLARAQRNALPAGGMPEVLIVLSDMHFDTACGGQRFAAEGVHKKFAAAGYTAPHIVFWNLAAGNNPVFQAETSTPGVSFMSGVSQQVLTAFVDDGVTSLQNATPWTLLHKTLAGERFDMVRHVAAAVGEGPLAGYVAPARNAAAGTGAGASAGAGVAAGAGAGGPPPAPVAAGAGAPAAPAGAGAAVLVGAGASTTA